MPGPLTGLEKAQIMDHLGNSNGIYQNDYARIYVQPVLDQLSNEDSLVIVRGHLAQCNAVQTKLGGSLTKVELDEAKGIKFSKTARGELISLHQYWVQRLADSLNITPNQTALYESCEQGII